MIEENMRDYLEIIVTPHGLATNFYLGVAVGRAVYPFGVITKISPGRDYTHTYPGDPLYEATMQCSCFAKSYYQAKMMAREVIAAMEDWNAIEVNVQAVFLLGETDLYEDDTKIFHIALDFTVWHTF